MRNVMLLSVLALLTASFSAEARPRHGVNHGGPRVRVVVPAPSLRVVINPWAWDYRPAPRSGWVWVEGFSAPDGAWIPGYWAPSQPRPGFVWVPGHWQGSDYSEGYWREAGRPGMVWLDGYYDRGRWVEGRWEADNPPPGPPPPENGAPVYHDYE